MNVVDHNNKAINNNSFSLDQETQALYNDVFVLIGPKQMFPFQAGSRKELWVFSDDDDPLHGTLKIRSFPIARVVGGQGYKPVPQHQQRQNGNVIIDVTKQPGATQEVMQKTIERIKGKAKETFNYRVVGNGFEMGGTVAPKKK